MVRPSLKAFLKNFDTYEGSTKKKMRKAVTNNLKKVTTLSECCGHHGEPGC
jgi:hypothetical protein